MMRMLCVSLWFVAWVVLRGSGLGLWAVLVFLVGLQIVIAVALECEADRKKEVAAAELAGLEAAKRLAVASKRGARGCGAIECFHFGCMDHPRCSLTEAGNERRRRHGPGAEEVR